MSSICSDLLVYLLWVLVAGVSGVIIALFSYFLDYCFWPGSIFKNYLPWLAKQLLKGRKDYAALNGMDGQGLVDLAGDIPLFKLLGGCAVCFNVWHCAISFAIVYFLVPVVPLWTYLPYMVTSSLLIRKLVNAL